MERRVIRIGAVAAALTALLALGAATASARTSLAPSLRLRARALQRAQALPHVFSLTTVFMQTAPVAVVRNGVTNTMTLAVFGDPAFGSSAIDVTLARAQPDGRAFQEHDYSFSPQSGIQFRFDKKGLETATLDTTTAITPSQIAGSFTATSVKARNCRLYDGRQATKLTATGTVAWSAFDVETSTSPFYGAIQTKPTHARIVKDPGCNTDVIVFSSGAGSRAVRAIPKVDSAIGAPAYSERRDQPCFFNRALGAKVGPGRVFGFEKFYRVPQIFDLAVRARQVPPDESEFHIIDAAAARRSLPKPVKVGPGRFQAVVHGAGGEFLNGTATFSSGPPAVRGGFSCRTGGGVRPFTRLTYRGTLDPSPATPLVASFDTLPLALREGTPATYVVREYGRHHNGD
jgi:hypothetical protein